MTFARARKPIPVEGAIKVSVKFIVPDERTEEILALKEERRVIRLRVGAHSWSLYRDLTAPDRWH